MAIDVRKLRGAMMSAGYPTLKDAARAIGMHPVTMYRRIKSEDFTLKQVKEMIKVFQIGNVKDIFFPDL